MTARRETPPISVNIGLKAGLEVKAEIPKKSVGRLVDSLTDIIRPFTEARGLRADQIRLQREDVLIEITKKAKERAAIDQIKLNPLPLKMLVPFLERASTEDLDAEMRDCWAALLLSASREFHARHLTFLDILSRLSSDELKILEEACFSYPAFPETEHPNGHPYQNRSRVEAALQMLVAPPGSDGRVCLHRYDRFIKEVALTYGNVMHLSVHVKGGGTSYFYSERGSSSTPGFRSLEILQRERLLEIERSRHADLPVQEGYYGLTFLGISFVQDCSPDAPRMAARRLAPKKLPS